MQLIASADNEILDSDDMRPYWFPAWIPKVLGFKNGISITPKGYLGKLGFKVEPAGKVRVFAMVDA